MSLVVKVEIEEDFYSYEDAQNGAGPFWCHGNTSIVECKGKVFAAGLETLPDVKPLCNCVPVLYLRTEHGWQVVYRGTGRTREPSPLCCFEDGRIFLSLNTTLSGEDEYAGPAKPSVLVFDADNPYEKPVELMPGWAGEPAFIEHSYRSFVADSERGELLLVQNIGYTHAEWTFMDSEDHWSAQGQLNWLWSKQYDIPQATRTCYPNVQLKNRAMYFCGVSDISEPYKEIRDYKKELTGRDWDYDFRRLLFTWSDDITTGKFHQWMEISSRDSSCGTIFPMDMYVDDTGMVHILWTEVAIDERLREKFYPLEKQSRCLNYAQIRNGIVRLRKPLYVGAEGECPGSCTAAKFHVMPDGRMLILMNLNAEATGGESTIRLSELKPDGNLVDTVELNIKQPFTSMFNNTVRGGSPPSSAMHVLASAESKVRYLKLSIE